MASTADLPPALVDRGFRVASAQANGVARARIDARDLRRGWHGPRGSGSATRLQALAAGFTADQAFTGPTAAVIWGIPLPVRLGRDERTWVSTMSRDRAMRRPGVVGSRRSSGEPRIRSGLPVLDPIAVWMSLAGLLAPHDLIAAGEFLITGDAVRPPLVSVHRMRATVAASPGVRNVRPAAEALARMRVGAWSRPETLVRLLVTSVGIPEPELNPRVVSPPGGLAHPDLDWPEFAVSLDYDGRWHDDPRQRARDREHREILVDAGRTVVPATAHELFHRPDLLVSRLLLRLTAGGYRPPAGAPVERAHLPHFEP